MHRLGMVLHLLGDVQDMGKNHLRYRIGAIRRYIGNDNAAFAGCIDINDVISGSHHSDIFQLWQCSHHFGCNDNLIGQHHLGIGGTFKYFFRSSTVVNDTFAQSLQFIPGKVSRIGGIAV